MTRTRATLDRMMTSYMGSRANAATAFAVLASGNAAYAADSPEEFAEAVERLAMNAGGDNPLMLIAFALREPTEISVAEAQQTMLHHANEGFAGFWSVPDAFDAEEQEYYVLEVQDLLRVGHAIQVLARDYDDWAERVASALDRLSKE